MALSGSGILKSEIFDLIESHEMNYLKNNYCENYESAYSKLLLMPHLAIDYLIYKVFCCDGLAELVDDTKTFYTKGNHNSPQCCYSLNSQLYISKLLYAKPSNVVQMVFNIGPNFVQIIYWDNILNSTQIYLFVQSSQKIKRIIQNKKCVFWNDSSETGQDFFIQINVFRQKCICSECIMNSYSYNLNHYNNQTKHTSSILKIIFDSSYCNIFTNTWTCHIMEKLLLHLNARNKYLFSSMDAAIKVHETICQMTKYLNIQHLDLFFVNMQLLEFKHSALLFILTLIINFVYHNGIEIILKYLRQFNSVECEFSKDNNAAVDTYFMEKSLGNIHSSMCKDNFIINNLDCFHINKIHNYISKGKEKRGQIAGVNLFSFKTEKDMIEYMDLETQIRKCPHSGPDNENLGIIPTKTNDITKIKGWRNKCFSTDCNKQCNVQFNNNSESNLDMNCLKINLSKDFEIPDKIEDVAWKSVWDNSFSSHKIASELSERIEKHKELETCAFESSILDDILMNLDIKITFAIPSDFERSTKELNVPNDCIMEAHLGLGHQVKIKEETCSKYDKAEHVSNVLYKQLGNCSDGTNLQKETYNTKASHFIPQCKPGCKYVWVQNRPIRIASSRYSSAKKRFIQPMTFQNYSLIDDIKKLRIPLAIKMKSLHRGPVYSGVASDNSQKNVGLSKPADHKNGGSEQLSSSTSCHKSNAPEMAKHNRQYTLLNNFIDKDDIILKKLELPTSEDSLINSVVLSHYSKCQFPSVHLCRAGNTEGHNNCCQRNVYTLGMVINVGLGRALHKGVLTNLKLLQQDETVLTQFSATLAASAILGDELTVSRFLIPVVNPSIIKYVESNNFSGTSLIKKYNVLNIDSGVKDVVSNLIDFTERQFEIHEIDFDPDIPPFDSPRLEQGKKEIKGKDSKVVRELKKLINVSIVDIYQKEPNVKSGEKCNKEFCNKGCICDSLNDKLPFPYHCGKINCMFECNCIDKNKFISGSSKRNQGIELNLAKEEMTWHQTVIRKTKNDIEVMTSGIEKGKREKKLPTRFRNNVLLGKEMSCIDTRLGASLFPVKTEDEFLEPTDLVLEKDNQEFQIVNPEKCPKTVVAKNEDKPYSNSKCDLADKSPHKILGNSITVKEAHWDKYLPIKQQIMERRLRYCSRELTRSQTLADVFIWCAIHNKYNCLCGSWVSMLKRNMLIWKPERQTRYLANKVMFDIRLDRKENFTKEVFLFNNHEHCARTFGILFNYRERNRHPVFKTKRACELQNHITSYSNSFVKIKLFLSLDKPWDRGAEPYDNFPLQTHTIEYINFRSKNCQDVSNMLVDVEDNGGDIGPCYEDDIEECSPPFTPPMMIEGGKQTETRVSSNEELKMAEEFEVSDAQSNCEEDLQSQLPDDSELTSSLEKHFTDLLKKKKVKKLQVSLLKNKMKKTNSLIEVQKKCIDIINTQKIDSYNSNEGLTTSLSQTPLCGDTNQFNAVDLPKFGLLCLTDGIGYLRVPEFTPSKLVVQDPQYLTEYHTFSNLQNANMWLNRFFKNRVIFDSVDTELKWVIVKPGILKLKQLKEFSTSLLEDPSVVITKTGLLHKKRLQDVPTGTSVLKELKTADQKKSIQEVAPSVLTNIKSQKRKSVTMDPHLFSWESKKLKIVTKDFNNIQNSHEPGFIPLNQANKAKSETVQDISNTTEQQNRKIISRNSTSPLPDTTCFTVPTPSPSDTCKIKLQPTQFDSQTAKTASRSSVSQDDIKYFPTPQFMFSQESIKSLNAQLTPQQQFMSKAEPRQILTKVKEDIKIEKSMQSVLKPQKLKPLHPLSVSSEVSIKHVPYYCLSTNSTCIRAVIVPKVPPSTGKNNESHLHTHPYVNNIRNGKIVKGYKTKLQNEGNGLSPKMQPFVQKGGQTGFIRNNKFYPISITRIPATTLLKPK